MRSTAHLEGDEAVTIRDMGAAGDPLLYVTLEDATHKANAHVCGYNSACATKARTLGQKLIAAADDIEQRLADASARPPDRPTASAASPHLPGEFQSVGAVAAGGSA